MPQLRDYCPNDLLGEFDAADARAAKTFEDVEDARNSIKQALTLLDVHTEGGIKVLLDAIESLRTTQQLGAPGSDPAV